jgi:hypothetical protein
MQRARPPQRICLSFLSPRHHSRMWWALIKARPGQERVASLSQPHSSCRSLDTLRMRSSERGHTYPVHTVWCCLNHAVDYRASLVLDAHCCVHANSGTSATVWIAPFFSHPSVTVVSWCALLEPLAADAAVLRSSEAFPHTGNLRHCKKLSKW